MILLMFKNYFPMYIINFLCIFISYILLRNLAAKWNSSSETFFLRSNNFILTHSKWYLRLYPYFAIAMKIKINYSNICNSLFLHWYSRGLPSELLNCKHIRPHLTRYKFQMGWIEKRRLACRRMGHGCKQA